MANRHVSSRFAQMSPPLGSLPGHALFTLIDLHPQEAFCVFLHIVQLLASRPLRQWQLLEGPDCLIHLWLWAWNSVGTSYILVA